MICKCGQTAKPIELVKDGAVVDVGYMCDPCFDQALAGLEVWRSQFNDLIAAGCPRDKANTIVIARMNAEPAS